MDYEGIEAKFDRAVQHLESFENVLGTWIKANPVRMVIEPDAGGVSESLFIEIEPPIPPALNVIAGDCIHNFRSVLDHLAMSLGIENGASPNDTGISFPVCNTFKAFYGYHKTEFPIRTPRWAGATQISALGPAAQVFIEGLQPHVAPPTLWELSQLQYLDNLDKHRSLIGHHVEVIATFSTPPGVTVEYESRLRLKDGAKFATVTFAPSYEDAKVYPQIVAEISVDRFTGTGCVPVQSFLRDLLLPVIRDIVDSAKRQF